MGLQTDKEQIGSIILINGIRNHIKNDKHMLTRWLEGTLIQPLKRPLKRVNNQLTNALIKQSYLQTIYLCIICAMAINDETIHH